MTTQPQPDPATPATSVPWIKQTAEAFYRTGWLDDTSEFNAFCDLLAKHAPDFTALSERCAALEEDKARLDWLDAETRGEHGFPVAQLVVKRFHKRDSLEWANTIAPIRAAIDAARSSVAATGHKEGQS